MARVLSKLGVASRTSAAAWVRAGRVRVNGRPVLDPEYPVRVGRDLVEVDEAKVAAPSRLAKTSEHASAFALKHQGAAARMARHIVALMSA